MTDQTRKICQAIAKLPTDPLLRTDLGRFGFEELAPRFEQIRGVFAALGEANVDLPPDPDTSIHRLGDRLLNRLYPRFGQVNPSESAYPQQTESLKDEFQKLAYDVVSGFGAIAIVAGLGRKPVDELLAERDAAAQREQAELQAHVKAARLAASEIAEKLKLIDTSVAAAMQSVEGKTISDHETVFRREASLHFWTSVLWFCITVGLGWSAGWLAQQEWNETIQPTAQMDAGPTEIGRGDQQTKNEIRRSIARVALLSILVSLMWMAARMFRAAQHNQVVNRHRANALATFQAFANTGTPEVRTAVLLQTTTCIFSQQPTGLIPNEPDPNPTSHIVDEAYRVRRRPDSLNQATLAWA